MVLEPDTGWCASKDAGPPREVDCEIPHRLERRTKHCLKGCGNLSLLEVFQNLEESPEGKTQREQYLLAVGLNCYKWYQSKIPGGLSARTLSPPRGGIVRSQYGLERRTKHCL